MRRPRSPRTLLACTLVGSLAAAACGSEPASAPGVIDDPGDALAFVSNGPLNGRRPFPANNWWNTPIDAEPVDPASATLIASCGVRGLHPDFGTTWNGAPNGIPYALVGGSQKKRGVKFTFASESDPGPYPVPKNPPIEGGANGTGDRHVVVVDTLNWKLYELFDAHPVNGGATWRAGSGAIFDLNSNALRPMYWTSADAAGLPIFPGLVRYDEAVVRKQIDHALRFTCPRTRRAFVDPARHFASSDTSSALPPMGMRVRLKAAFDVSSYPAEVRVILAAMKRYGMFVADNGSGWYVSGAPDPRWSDSNLATLSRVPSSAFEVVRMGTIRK
jgi:hypothetical protein